MSSYAITFKLFLVLALGHLLAKAAEGQENPNGSPPFVYPAAARQNIEASHWMVLYGTPSTNRQGEEMVVALEKKNDAYIAKTTELFMPALRLIPAPDVELRSEFTRAIKTPSLKSTAPYTLSFGVLKTNHWPAPFGYASKVEGSVDWEEKTFSRVGEIDVVRRSVAVTGDDDDPRAIEFFVPFVAVSISQEYALVEIDSQPSEADVDLSGVKGRTKFDAFVSPGKHEVSVEKNGYEPDFKKFTAKGGGEYKITFRLKQAGNSRP